MCMKNSLAGKDLRQTNGLNCSKLTASVATTPWADEVYSCNNAGQRQTSGDRHVEIYPELSFPILRYDARLVLGVLSSVH